MALSASALVWHGLVAMAAVGLMGSLCKFCDRWGGPGTRGLIGVLDKVGATALGILVRGRGGTRRGRLSGCLFAHLLFTLGIILRVSGCLFVELLSSRTVGITVGLSRCLNMW